MRGVYAVGRPELSRRGLWMAAVLACGPHAALSHWSAAALWGFGSEAGSAIHVSVPASVFRNPRGLVVHRRRVLGPGDLTTRDAIPVLTIVPTFVDVAAEFDRPRLERAINEADRLGLIDPEALRRSLAPYRYRRGVAGLRELLDRHTFRMTNSELERHFLPLVDAVGLPRPETKQWINGFEVDFYWPELGLVVETDGLRYHRTPVQQARDRLRDQVHTASGLTTLRFTHGQVKFESAHVRDTLAAVARQLVARRRT